jgi:hypothetical protein
MAVAVMRARRTSPAAHMSSKVRLPDWLKPMEPRPKPD